MFPVCYRNVWMTFSCAVALLATSTCSENVQKCNCNEVCFHFLSFSPEDCQRWSHVTNKQCKRDVLMSKHQHKLQTWNPVRIFYTFSSPVILRQPMKRSTNSNLPCSREVVQQPSRWSRATPWQQHHCWAVQPQQKHRPIHKTWTKLGL